jgi:hypothetical protein
LFCVFLQFFDIGIFRIFTPSPKKINMFNKFSLMLIASFLAFSIPNFAQHEHHWCGTYDEPVDYDNEVVQQQLIADQEFEELFQMGYFEESGRDGELPLLIIPTVVHIIHNYGPEFGVTDDDVQDMIRRMNDDFNNRSADTANISQPFKDRVGNTRIEFRLARKDPSGNCTNGITRHVSPLTAQGDAAMKNIVLWPRNRYYKIWVCRAPSASTNVLGYFSPNPFNIQHDGIVVRYTEVNYASRTMTHETGHWLNLAHTWGPSNNPGLSTNCQTDDGVTDTPPTIGNLTSACPLTQFTCPNQQPASDPVLRDNVENHMDYTGCARMFTAGQTARMRAAAFSTNRNRNNLHTTANLALTGLDGEYGPVCTVDFEVDKTFACVGQEITLKDLSYHDITTREWNIPGATVISQEDDIAVISFDEPGVYSVTLNVTNENNNTGSTTKNNIFEIFESLPGDDFVMEDFESTTSIPNDLWLVESLDGGVSNTWAINTNVGFESNQSVFIQNNNKPEGRIENLVLRRTLDADFESGNMTVTFKYAFAPRTSALPAVDRLRVLTSVDCGNSWSVRANILNNTLRTAPPQTANFVPNNEQWNTRTITAPAPNFVSDEFLVRFEWTSGTGNNIYIDDINIFNPTTVNINEFNLEPFSMLVYPNPANDQAVLEVNLTRNAQVNIEVFDLAGRQVAQIANQSNLGEGQHIFNIGKYIQRDGMYFIRMSSDNVQKTEKFIFQR